MTYNDLRKGRHSEPGRPFFLTMVTDQRMRWFDDFDIARIVIKEMMRLDGERALESLAWVLMPYHLHWLMVLGDGKDLSRIARSLKGGSARRINLHLARRGPIWQAGFHDHALRHDEDIRAFARYTVANPLRAGLVSRLADYPHWDAVWLEG